MILTEKNLSRLLKLLVLLSALMLLVDLACLYWLKEGLPTQPIMSALLSIGSVAHSLLMLYCLLKLASHWLKLKRSQSERK